MKVLHFASAADFRRWFEKNHASATELLVGYYKKASGRGGMSYLESVDEALCFGWIDGVIRKIDADSYSHRFTPRKPGSHWSNVNVRHVARLTAAGNSNKEIAAQLELSVKTVETYRARAMEKLGLGSRTELVRHASRVGWLNEG